MIKVLVDTSIWIDYFRGGNSSTGLDALINENLVLTNDIILAELIPYLKVKKQVNVIKLLKEINRIPFTSELGGNHKFSGKVFEKWRKRGGYS